MTFIAVGADGQSHEVDDEYDPAGNNVAMQNLEKSGYQIQHKLIHKSGEETHVPHNELSNALKTGQFYIPEHYDALKSARPVATKINEVAAKTGTDPETLAARASGMGLAPETANPVVKGLASATGIANSALFGVPSYLAKKMEDTKTQQAIDMLRPTVEQSKPTIQKAAEFGGALASPIPGSSEAGPLTKALGIGALTGLTDSQTGDEGKSTLAGAALGGATGALGAGIGKGINKLQGASEGLENMAGRRAFKAAGGMLKDERTAERYKGGTANVGQQLLESGIVKAGDTVDTIAKKATAAKDTYGKKISDFVDNVRQKYGDNPDHSVNMANIKLRVENEIGSQTQGVPFVSNRDAIERELGVMMKPFEVKDQAGHVIGFNNLSFADANALRQKLDKQIQAAYKNPSANPLQQQQMQFRSILDDEIMKSLDKIGTTIPDSGVSRQAFKDLQGKWSLAKTASDMAADKVLRNQANRTVSPSDYVMGLGGAATGASIGYHEGGVTGAVEGAATGGALGVANHMMRSYGNSAAAAGLMKASQLLDKSPEQLGQFGRLLSDALKRGQNSYLATHATLYKNNPDYRKIIDSQNDRSEQQ